MLHQSNLEIGIIDYHKPEPQKFISQEGKGLFDFKKLETSALSRGKYYTYPEHWVSMFHRIFQMQRKARKPVNQITSDTEEEFKRNCFSGDSREAREDGWRGSDVFLVGS